MLAPAIESGTVERVTEALRTQLAPTWRLMWQAVDLLRALPEGASVATRWESDRGSFSMMAEQVAEGAPPQARRDGAVAAASRLSRMERAQAAFEVQRAYDDPLVMAEYRLTGEAFAGEVIETDPEHTEGEGPLAQAAPCRPGQDRRPRTPVTGRHARHARPPRPGGAAGRRERRPGHPEDHQGHGQGQDTRSRVGARAG
ncbi:hypothetical protein [Nonomuraea dietziae]|uniref:hypothetical protein n=1 Tax=Nonomuraea dietziae TaxID=65515 RepID=UPI0031D1B1E6